MCVRVCESTYIKRNVYVSRKVFHIYRLSVVDFSGDVEIEFYIGSSDKMLARTKYVLKSWILDIYTDFVKGFRP